MSCCRTKQAGEVWQTLQKEESINEYGRLLHKWTHALMMSIEGATTDYHFPLTDTDITRLALLKNALKQKKADKALEALHDVFKHIFYPRSLPHPMPDFSKFNNPIECLMALSNIRDDGNFKQATDVTQMFAQIHYHMRGSMLFEGTRHAGEFDNDLARQVFFFFLVSLLIIFIPIVSFT